MFNQNKGTIDNKKNRKLIELIKIRKKKKLEEADQEKKRKKELEKKKKQVFIIDDNTKTKYIKDNIDTTDNTKVKITKKKGKKKEESTKKNNSINEKEKSKTDIAITPIKDKKKELVIDVIKCENKQEIKKESNDEIKNFKKQETKNTNTTSYSNKNGKQETKYDKNREINEKQEKSLLELALTNELEVILKEHQYDLNKLIVEFNVINEHVDEVVETSEIEKMSDEIDDLVKKLEIIKRELELLTNSATFKNIYKLHDSYLTNLIDEYKDTLTKSSELMGTVEQLENNNLYISLIDKIIEFEAEKEKLADKLNETCEKYRIRDENFEKWKDDYTDIEKTTKSLDELIYTSTQKLQEIEEKVSKSVNVTEIIETRLKSGLGIIAKTMLIMALLKKNPTRKANGLAAVTTLTAISLVNDLIKPKKVTTKHIVTDLVDYRNMINNTINDVENINTLISKSLSEVEKLKKHFEKEFKEYQYDFPEYKDFIDKLNNIEQEMFDRQNNMKKISNELSLQYDKNNAKVKKYGNYS